MNDARNVTEGCRRYFLPGLRDTARDKQHFRRPIESPSPSSLSLWERVRVRAPDRRSPPRKPAAIRATVTPGPSPAEQEKGGCRILGSKDTESGHPIPPGIPCTSPMASQASGRDAVPRVRRVWAPRAQVRPASKSSGGNILCRKRLTRAGGAKFNEKMRRRQSTRHRRRLVRPSFGRSGSKCLDSYIPSLP